MSSRVGEDMPLSMAWLLAACSVRKFLFKEITRKAKASPHIINADRVYGKLPPASVRWSKLKYPRTWYGHGSTG